MQKDHSSQFPKKLALILKKEREKAGFSQGMLARKAGISRQSLSAIENLECNPTMFTIFKLTGALGISLEELGKQIDLCFPDTALPVDSV